MSPLWAPPGPGRKQSPSSSYLEPCGARHLTLGAKPRMTSLAGHRQSPQGLLTALGTAPKIADQEVAGFYQARPVLDRRQVTSLEWLLAARDTFLECGPLGPFTKLPTVGQGQSHWPGSSFAFCLKGGDPKTLVQRVAVSSAQGHQHLPLPGCTPPGTAVR